MKTNFLKITLFALVAVMVSITACKKDQIHQAPEVEDPAIQSVMVTESVDITFNFKAEAGYNSSTVSATKGDAVIKTDASADAESGSVVVTFKAGTAHGTGSVKLTVTDNDGQSSSAVAVIDVAAVPTYSVTENITTNTTWETGNIYILEGRIKVMDGATLTIEPGVVVKGREGTDINAKALIVARGGKLMANGTAGSPIIFTSVQDEILPGQIESPNLLPTDRGLWGGLIILGKAQGSFKGDVSEYRIEGLPETDPDAFYGGSIDDDNSGSITYVSIRHGGSLLGEGNEINGLTLGAVGSATVIDHIEVIANEDDGIEWFGGTVNVSNVVVWNVNDDAIDTDQSWRGTLDNFVIINPTNSCFELDGPEGSVRIGGLNHTIQNGTVLVQACGASLCDNDLDTDGGATTTNVNMNSVYFYITDFTKSPTYHTFPWDGTYGWNDCTFSNLEIAPSTVTLTDYFEDGFDAFATAVDHGSQTVGADLSEFDGWSWARVDGQF